MTDFANKIVAVLVQRLGGRVEISPNEIDAIFGNGEQLVAIQPPTSFQYVLELQQPMPDDDEQPKRRLADYRSPEGREWRAAAAENIARHYAGLPPVQPVESRAAVVNRDQS